MFLKSKKTPQSDFIVANFKSKDLSDSFREWRDSHTFGVAMSCFRQVWYGTNDDFSDFPDQDLLLRGKDAYAFILKLLVGMDSPKEGEVNIKGQFYQNWENYKTSNPNAGQKLESVMQHLKADSRAVQGAILSKHKRHEHCLVARDLAGATKQKAVLIVGDLSRHGDLALFTEGIIRRVSSKNQKAAKIVITHPNLDTAELLYNKAMEMKASGIITSALEKLNFDDLSIAFERADHVFVDTVMDDNPEADLFMINAWQSRSRNDNLLIHLRGRSYEYGIINPPMDGCWIKKIHFSRRNQDGNGSARTA